MLVFGIHRKGILLGLALAVLPTVAWATENDESHASFGYIDTLAGLPPPPGFYVRDDVEGIFSSRINDGNGNKANINLGRRLSLPVRFRETALVDILSAAWVPDYRVPYINATIGAAAFIGYASARVGFETRIRVPERKAVNSPGFSDLNVAPIFLGFDVPKADLHFIFAPLTFVAPVGRYSSSLQSNIGLNYFSYRPSLGITYLNKTGQEVSFNLAGFVNSRNPTTKYKSGSEFYAGYAFQQYLSPRFAFGIGGYYYRQLSDDTQNGKTVASTPATDILNSGPGNRGETFAIGPIISYNPTNSLAFQAHWDHEVFSYNRDLRDLVYIRGVLKF